MSTTNSQRKCRKCGQIIPVWAKVEGKRRSLFGRKFCLTCSPYRGHNTSPHDPVFRRKTSYEYRETVTLSLYKKGLARKIELIERSGGKCKRCGYNKNRRALTFHHLDPEKKLFGLTLNQLWSKSQQLIDEEWAKCEMLCMNCHAEIEDEIAGGKGIVARVNAKYGTAF